MTHLALYAAHNAKGKRDATHAFIPEAKKWAETARCGMHWYR